MSMAASHRRHRLAAAACKDSLLALYRSQPPVPYMQCTLASLSEELTDADAIVTGGAAGRWLQQCIIRTPHALLLCGTHGALLLIDTPAS